MKKEGYLIIIAILLIIITLGFTYFSGQTSTQEDEVKRLKFKNENLQLIINDKNKDIIKFNIRYISSIKYQEGLEERLKKEEKNEIKTFNYFINLPIDGVGVESSNYFERHKDDRQ